MKRYNTVPVATTVTQGKKPNLLLSFTGLIPVVLTIPILILHLWTISIIVTIVSAIIVISYHLVKKQGITSLDIFSLLFGLVNAVLYFGFHSTLILQHLDTVIYSILLLQVVFSLLQGKPWTEQYARRSVAAELWTTKPFHETNRFLTILWGIVFFACDLISLFVSSDLPRTLLPVILLVLLAVLTPRLSRWFAARYMPQSSTS